MFSLHSCGSSSVNFWGGEGNLAGNLRDFFGSHEIKARKFRENFGAFFVRTIVAQKESFVQSSLCRRAALSLCVSLLPQEIGNT